MKKHIAILAFAAFATLGLASCKTGNNTSTQPVENARDSMQEQAMPHTQAQVQTKTADLDVVHFASLYCKTTDLDKARIFLGKVTDSLFTVRKDIENNYAVVSAKSGDQNTLEFYMWTDKDGEKILGVNLTECGEKGHNKRALQFLTYDSRLNLAVPCKRLNEVITNKLLSMRRSYSSFILRTPTSPENENITLQYYDKQKKYHELVFVWDGKTFNVE